MWKKTFLVIILLSSIANAAIIQGTIYDISLNKEKNIVLEINTKPNQRVISKYGSYSFNVPMGEYTIEAKKIEDNLILSSTTEIITIQDDNTYNLDLFLYPNLEDEETLLGDDIDIPQIFEEEKTNATLLIWLAVFLLLIILFFVYKPKKKTKTLNKDLVDEDLQKVINIIKKQGNRTTQKEIRKSLGLSEAKVSLMITELESLNKIKRIKKGRGNIIILVK